MHTNESKRAHRSQNFADIGFDQVLRLKKSSDVNLITRYAKKSCLKFVYKIQESIKKSRGRKKKSSVQIRCKKKPLLLLCCFQKVMFL